VLLGVLFSGLSALSNPIAWAGFWGVQAVMLAIYTKLTWQRTRLFWMTEGGAHAAVVSAAMVLASLAGYTIPTLPFHWRVIFLANAGWTAASYFIARSVHRKEFEAWRQHMQPMSMWDMLRFRHIPHLQEGRRRG
jgi:MFS family permease